MDRRNKEGRHRRPRSAQLESLQYGDDGYLTPRNMSRKPRDAHARPHDRPVSHRDDDRPYVIQMERPRTEDLHRYRRREYRDEDYYRQVVKRTPRSYQR